MSATINTGWLKGKNGVKFAPKTLSSQVITNDGIALEEKIAADLNEIRTYIDETVSGNEGGGPHDHNDTYYTESEIDSMLSTTASTIKNDLLNGAGEAYDTLKELGELIDENTDAIEALELIATNKMDKNNPVGTGSFSLNREGDIGENSVAIGNEVTASGQYSYAEGSGTTASGKASHAEGSSTTASGENSHAEGSNTTAASEAQHVQGRYNIIDEEGVYLHIVGNGITDKAIGKQRSNAHTLDWEGNAWYQGEVRVGGSSYGDASTLTTSKYVDDKFSITAGEKVVGKTFTVYNSNIGRDETIIAEEGAEIFNDYSRNIATGMCSHAEGRSTVATGMYSHAEGEQSKSSGYASHAEGSSTASNQYAHGEGDGTTASGYASHTEGYRTTASGNRSHAEGSETEAFGFISHAEGRLTKALGEHSHAEGYGTDASGNAQHVQGKYNIIDAESKYAHIVGNGESNYARSNAHTLDWEGNGWFASDVYVGGTSQDDVNAKKLATEEFVTASIENKQDKITDTLILADTITGEKYKIQIQNGQLVTSLIEEEV